MGSEYYDYDNEPLGDVPEWPPKTGGGKAPTQGKSDAETKADAKASADGATAQIEGDVKGGSIMFGVRIVMTVLHLVWCHLIIVRSYQPLQKVYLGNQLDGVDCIVLSVIRVY